MKIDVGRSLKQARKYLKAGDTEKARALFEAILETFPGNKTAQDGLKSLSSQANSVAGATDPDKGQLENLIAVVNQGHLADAVQTADALSLQFPNSAILYNILGTIHLKLKDHQQAIEKYQLALKINPRYAEVYNNLGTAHQETGQLEDAIDSFEKATKWLPNYAQAHNNLGVVFKATGNTNGAIKHYSMAIDLKPDYASPYNNIAIALEENGQHELAMEHYQKAISIDPMYFEAFHNMANNLSHQGNRVAAIENYTKAIALNPGYAEAHLGLSGIKAFSDGDPQLEQIKCQLSNPSLSDMAKIQFLFCLGWAYEQLGDYDTSFRYLSEGNQLRKKILNYDIRTDQNVSTLIRRTFSNKTPTLERGIDYPKDTYKKPIFIVGMPRSGTTLVEQIVASHSLVHGAGELPYLFKGVKEIGWNAATIDKDQLKKLRAYYLNQIANKSDLSLITDKMPLNYRWIGLIISAIPEAKIVHIKRDARATCWSNFRYFFSAGGLGYAHNLDDLSQYYKLYVELMDFWSEKYPDSFYQIDYEYLTENQEAETRRLIDYLELDWEDSLLNFHNSGRHIATASSNQIRKKMYINSSLEWKKYETHLHQLAIDLENF